MDLVILDLEWNGSYSKKVHHYVNEVIEFGAVKVGDDLKYKDSFSMLVKPEIGKKLSSHIASLTHITNEELFEEGISFMQAAYEFIKFSEDCVILTWGTSDILTLMDNFNYFTLDSKIPFLKKYCNLQEYCEYQLDAHNPAAQLGLINCAEMLGIKSDEEELHRACTDAHLSLECLRRTFDKEKFSEYVCDADDDFYRKITFKNKQITDINNPLIDKSQLYFICDDCHIRAEQLTHFRVKNKNFVAKFRCPKCRKVFNGRISMRLKFDGVTMKKKTYLNEPPKLED
ncbi:MAG: exonuclease domain-containing protein [Ruminococcus sp.]|nr:exonuclease domain-containing protein [Ruminococcus sp.]